jgi:hypothetical protein
MSKKNILLIFILCSKFSLAQTEDHWVKYIDTIKQLVGYKDLAGNIKIPARYSISANADKFYNIMAISEKVDSNYCFYYLLRDGTKVGRDSVFSFDSMNDCESEGKILFLDRKKDRVGFFDKNGVVIIPAVYNIATPFHNGLAIAMRNAKRECWDTNEDTLTCEHLSWTGGEIILINEKNEILADSLTWAFNNINWYSLKTNTSNIDTTICMSLKGRNGNTYSFINYEKEFTKWFKTKFLVALNSSHKHNLAKYLFTEITYSAINEWKGLPKNKWLDSFPTVLTKSRFKENKLKQLSIVDVDFNSLIYEGPTYNEFFTACGLHNKEKFPTFLVMLTYYKKCAIEVKLAPLKGSIPDPTTISDFTNQYEIDYQENFEFIKTKDGYQLYSVQVKGMQK